MRLRVCAISIALSACGGAKAHPSNPPPSDTVVESQDAGATDAAPLADEGADAGAVAQVEVHDAGPTHPPVDIRGKCVDPIADAKGRAKLPKISDLSTPPTRVDLDGDGVEDWIITTGTDTESSGYVYITRRNCGIFALNWHGTEPVPSETWTRGFVDLQVSAPCRVNCCRVEQIVLYKWNGHAYAKAGARTATRACLGAGGHP